MTTKTTRRKTILSLWLEPDVARRLKKLSERTGKPQQRYLREWVDHGLRVAARKGA